MHRLFNYADDGSRFVELGLLLEQTDGVAGAAEYFARVVVILPRDNTEQCGLARAIQAEHADLGAVVEAKGDIAQDLFVRRDEASHAVHGVDDLGIRWHSGLILPYVF